MAKPRRPMALRNLRVKPAPAKSTSHARRANDLPGDLPSFRGHATQQHNITVAHRAILCFPAPDSLFRSHTVILGNEDHWPARQIVTSPLLQPGDPRVKTIHNGAAEDGSGTGLWMMTRRQTLASGIGPFSASHAAMASS